MKRRDLFKAPALVAGLALQGARPLSSTSSAEPFPSAPGLTRSVSSFIVNTTYKDIPDDVLALGKKSILDGLGLALAGSVSTLAPLLQRYLASLGLCGGKSAVIGTALRVPPRFAAFANGAFIHADDFDDTQLAVAKDRVYGLLTHPTVPVLPPALALCEAEGKSGKDLLLAYHLGVEVECKIAEAIDPRHYNDGFHSTGTIGSFGSAAACARLKGLDEGRTAQALGLAAAQAGGLRDNFGTMTKPFHAGHAAESGVVAAELAALGWTAAADILEARFGFFQAAGGGFNVNAILGRLGKPWTFASPGVSIKPYPSGSLTHPAMGEMLRLVRLHGLKPADVTKVQVGANHSMVSTLLHHRPSTGLQAKFSLEFGIAIMLLDGVAGLAQYTDAAVQRPDVQELIKRVEVRVAPEADRAGLDRMTSILDVHLKDGRVVSGRADFAKGSPANPMTYAEVADKFRACAEFARWPVERTRTALEAVAALENQADLGVLSAALSG